MNYENDLSSRQIEAVNKLTASRGGIVWWKIGEGKTRIALAWASHFGETLVICSPNAFRQWEDEAALFSWSPKLRFLSYGKLSGFAGLTGVNCIVIDELWLYKNIRAKRTLDAGIITSSSPTLGLSGSMVTARNIEDVYGQTYAVGISGLLSKSLSHFRSQFCTSADTGYGLEFYAKRGSIEAIQERLAHNVDIYFPKETRATRFIPIRVDLTGEQKYLIAKLSREYYVALDEGTLEIKSASALISKIQQISDGAFYDNEGNVAHCKSNKFSRLLELCSEFADAGSRAIVWFAFKASLNAALSVLSKKATALSSEHKFDPQGWKTRKYQFTLATVGSGASLDDFANTEHAIFYSAPFSPLAFQQAMGRTNRKSTQTDIANYHMLMSSDTLDSYIYDLLNMSGRIEKTIIRSSMEVLRDYFDEQKKSEI